MKSFLAMLAVAMFVFVGCGDGGSGLPKPGPSSGDPGPVHVHGLGINPRDGALFIATHTGLFRVAQGQRVATRVANRYQDTMGFTIIGPDRFLGSGHPDQREDLPPLLGLIRSTDAGETWKSVSLLGRVDFHVLRYRHSRIYGFDATGNRLMISGPAGRTWRTRRVSSPLLDLVIAPSNPDLILASDEKSLLRSQDGGRSWKGLDPPQAGLLAWPAKGRLYLVSAHGTLAVSRDDGRTWRSRSRIGGQPAAFLAATPRELYVALHDGSIKRSTDAGVSWSIRSRPRGS